MLNQVNLIGNLAKDVDIKFMPNGTKVAITSIAVNNRVKKQDGTIKEKTLFIDIIAYSGRAEALEKYTQKGSRLRITGELELQQWEKDGQKHSKHVVSVNEFDFLDVKKGEANTINEEPVSD
ncbi:MAG: single-stranded DNA-binding protein, partial [Endomicrobium sp.]|nr:single-stranded DNA-binding protein [Endomicrobium sp.]